MQKHTPTTDKPNALYKEWLQEETIAAYEALHTEIKVAFEQFRTDWGEMTQVIGRDLSQWILSICQDAVRSTIAYCNYDLQEMEDEMIDYIDHAVDQEGVLASLEYKMEELDNPDLIVEVKSHVASISIDWMTTVIDRLREQR